MIVGVAPEIHSYYVTCENGTPIFHVELLKALYELLKSALKLYIKVVEDLKEEEFELIPHDGCVANKIVDGKHQNAWWHVDYLKLSHVDPEVNDKLVEKLMKKYEKIEKGSMKVIREKSTST